VVVVGSGPIDSTCERFSQRPDPVFNLELRTFRNRDQFGQDYTPNAGAVAETIANLVYFPDGDAQVSGCHRPKTSNNSRLKASEEEKQKIEADRARGELLKVCKWFVLNHLWTLTYRGPVTDRVRVYSDLHKWEREVRKSYPQFKAVGVLEVHPGDGPNHGGYHYHMGVNGFYDVNVFRAAWWKVVGEGMGNVQVESKCAEPVRKVALYLVKYLNKQIHLTTRKPGQHRYRRSQRMDIPVVTRRWEFVRAKEVEAEIREKITQLTGKPIVFEWWSEDGLRFMFRTFR
jgi:hypothetical protein